VKATPSKDHSRKVPADHFTFDLLAAILDAVESYAAVGKIFGAIRHICGEPEIRADLKRRFKKGPPAKMGLALAYAQTAPARSPLVSGKSTFQHPHDAGKSTVRQELCRD